jgi:hypothetical protein
MNTFIYDALFLLNKSQKLITTQPATTQCPGMGHKKLERTMAYGEPDWASPGATTPEATQNAATGSNISANSGAGGVRYVYFTTPHEQCCVEL